jgi:hypothetical protein
MEPLALLLTLALSSETTSRGDSGPCMPETPSAETSTPKEPTPDEIYRAAEPPFGAMVSAYELKQDFVEQNDGTYFGLVKPTFEQEQKVSWWSKEHIENIVGTWDDVSRRLGSLHDKSGKLVSIEKAFGIADEDRATYLVVTTIDSRTHPGERRCAASVIGVLSMKPMGHEKEMLVSRPYGTVSGCGLVKDVLSVAKPDYSKTSDPAVAWSMAQQEFIEVMAKALGFRLYKNTIPLVPKTTEEEEGGKTP